jgi:hypothetical protein
MALKAIHDSHAIGTARDAGFIQFFMSSRSGNNLHHGGCRRIGENPMNNVLSEILETGSTKNSSGSGIVTVVDQISPSEGQFLDKLVGGLDPTISLGVGLAYGISGLFICDALNVRNGTKHITIDPYQHGASWGILTTGSASRIFAEQDTAIFHDSLERRRTARLPN